MMLKLLHRKRNDKNHWEQVYNKKAPGEVTWYQERPVSSLELIAATGAVEDTAIIDIGGGASNLVDHLAESGFRNLTVLDLSGTALKAAQRRLGAWAGQISWLEADITKHEFTTQYEVWHDRAVFHFLIKEDERVAYIARLKRVLPPGGYAVISTFGPDGPRKCSGLPVMHYRPETLHDEIGDGFEMLESRYETHRAPTGHHQQFIYCLFRNKS
jgi:ubiquinone/menaquinone biosynthesis C-methylase UbiE